MDRFKATESLYQLLQHIPSDRVLQNLAVKQVWTADDREHFLNYTAELLLKPSYTLKIAELFSPILLDILHRCIGLEEEEEEEEKGVDHAHLCIALAKLVWLFPEASRFAYVYFKESPEIFSQLESEGSLPPAKKAKKNEEEMEEESLIVSLLQAVLCLLSFDTNFFRDVFDWRAIITFLGNDDIDVRWLAHQCMFRISNISCHEQNAILHENKCDSENGLQEMKHNQIFDHLWQYNPLNWSRVLTDMKCENGTSSRCIMSSDLLSNMVDVQGILLEKMSDSEADGSSLVLVESVERSLEALALAVSSNQPVLIQGPVGCGKTSLVEHLAHLTGRKLSEEVFKIQLGEQTDSKLLVGSYCCTEVPGEFVWQPGILTQALIGGYWLVLEDIDHAPMDIMSLLTPVIQSRSLLLPGHLSPVKAAVGFQLFATQRLVAGYGRSFVESKNSADGYNKMWRKITIQNLRIEELTKVIQFKWPVLKPITDRILKIYQLLTIDSLDDDEGDDDEEFDKPAFVSSLQLGRCVSSRDLFKFCSRVAIGFDLQSTDTCVNTFHNALDCFCDSIPSPAERVEAAECIGVQFNISKQKAAYFCKKYKPPISDAPGAVQIGRATLRVKERENVSFERTAPTLFAHTRQATYLLEKVAVALLHKEPVLLVGETGTGKTSIVQYLARITNSKLSVINMNQQSDSIDLLGGYKPVDMKLVVQPVKDEYQAIFPLTFSAKYNAKFLGHIVMLFSQRRWLDLFALMLHTYKPALERLNQKSERTPLNAQLEKRWKKLARKLQQLKLQLQHKNSPLAFSFIEGALVKAMRNGDWILLDEINLAEAETLQCLGSVLENTSDSLYLLEKGDKEPVRKHPDFRLFACMNPATDVGKKDLPVGIRNRFTEFFIEDLEDKSDLMILVESYLSALALDVSLVGNIVDFYLHIRKEAVQKLSDGTGSRPHYSLRTLCRALGYAALNPYGNVHRSLYEAFALSFLSQLDQSSYSHVDTAIKKFILGKKHSSILKQKLIEPTDGEYVPVQGYYIRRGSKQSQIQENYILTNTVKRNLHDMARIVSARRYPILLQGETSVGKTSLVTWLAQATGNHCVRVNNHEHTDIQEYTGSYCADSNGKLFFKEGVLVEAMRKGYWIILDELNLAPTEVMEALNRVLDDNRELFLTETQELIKAHPEFMVFATQNPPGLYGGRKVLSRAFRNRFIELHFNEIPPSELEVILEKRCLIPASYSKKMVDVMHELQVHRRESGIFAGKQSYITLRDLFRWGERYRIKAASESAQFYDWMQHVANEGYMLLAGRVRREEEAAVIQQVLEKHTKRTIDPKKLFSIEEITSMLQSILGKSELLLSKEFKHIVWTTNLRRLMVLVGRSLQYQEPVLLIGNTGCGKTTVCQIFADFFEKVLHTVNCHMHSESSDFLGNLRPVREPNEGNQKLFEWVDGPLVLSMVNGEFFLADEISLADDSVLERLNSVLEPERRMHITEKCGSSDEEGITITAKEDFRILATMNPGGDFGKKELSPSLRNRFTEIWCPSSMSNEELMNIIDQNISKDIEFSELSGNSGFGFAVVTFLNWFFKSEAGKRITFSIRDILTWIDFVNKTASSSSGCLQPGAAFVHGACLVFLDSLGSGSVYIGNAEETQNVKQHCYDKLLKLARKVTGRRFKKLGSELRNNWKSCTFEKVELPEGTFVGVGEFFIPIGSLELVDLGLLTDVYNFESYTVGGNTLRLFRALQLHKPILLEGNPGVGKTSLVSAIAKAAGYQVVRINLSEQTDVSDLFGADLPVNGGEAGQFAWRDGPLLHAIKNGSWILLDELNLASQSVLEGLNACLDHRGEIYVPELGKTFHVSNTTTRIFGCQNPYKQGASRKGLPRSFLNRFIQVFMEPFTCEDLKHITSSLNESIPRSIISDMVEFNELVVTKINEGTLCQRDGHLWSFNLRDIFRWCEVMTADEDEQRFNPMEHIRLIYADRLRTTQDRKKVMDLCESHCGVLRNEIEHYLQVIVTDSHIQVGHSFVNRKTNGLFNDNFITPLCHQLPSLESLMKCVEMNWMAILVGPPASGKSSLVKFLADVTGHTLKILNVNSEMDTTELLGGFEQADLNRHLDSILQDLEPYLNKAIAKCLLKAGQMQDRDVLSLLHAMLSNLDAARNFGHSSKIAATVTDEVCVCRLRIKKILKVLKVLESLGLDDYEVLSEIKQEVRLISDRLETNGVVSCGGRFEWVDSVLVHAVRKGYWLLIENVNFCCPSVLDRLNGFLEPGGVLMLTEQGVVDEDVLEVRPHPDFRIILTMDPQHGEISPAMRNRGVEICLINECVDPETYKQSNPPGDIISLLNSRGIKDSLLVIHFVNIFNAICFNVTDKPSSYDFLNIASLCIQNLQKNKDLQTALWDSFDFGFIRNILHQNDKKKCYDILKGLLSQVAVHDQDVLLCQKRLAVAGPMSLEFQHSAACASVKQKSFILYSLLRKFLCSIFGNKDLLSSVALSCVFPPVTAIDRWIRLLTSGMQIIYESCSTKHQTLFSEWLNLAVYDCLKEFNKEFEKERSIEEFEKGRCIVQSVLTTVLEISRKQFGNFNSFPITKELAITLKSLLNACPEFDECDIPVDPRWNLILFRKLQLKCTKSEPVDYDSVETHENVTTLGNRFLLFLDVSLVNCLYDETDSADYVHIPRPQKKAKSFRELSVAFNSGEISPENLPHPIILYIDQMVSCLSSCVLKRLAAGETISCSDEQYWELRIARNVYQEFIFFCHEDIPPGEIEDRVDMFKVHWERLQKHLDVFFQTEDADESIPDELRDVMHPISQHLHDDLSEIKNIRSNLSDVLGFPSPFHIKDSATLFADVLTLYEAIKIYNHLKPKDQMEDLKVIITNGSTWNLTLFSVTYRCLSSKNGNSKEFSTAHNSIHNMKLQISDAGLLKGNGDDDDDEIMEVCQQPAVVSDIKRNDLALQIELLPLYDYFFVQAEVLFLTDYFHDGEDRDVLDSKITEEWLIGLGLKKLNLDPFHLALLFHMCQNNEKKAYAVCLASLFCHMRTGPSAAEQETCLNWKNNEGIGMLTLKPSWGQQSSLLTAICLRLFSSIHFTGEMTLPLGNFAERSKQVAVIKNMLWRNWEMLPNKTLRETMVPLLMSWLNSLIIPLHQQANGSKSLEIPLRKQAVLKHITRKLGLEDIIVIGGTNVLCEASKWINQLEDKAPCSDNYSHANCDYFVGMGFFYTGISTVLLFSVMDSFDPMLKQQVKHKCIIGERNDALMEYKFRDWLCRVLSGKPLQNVEQDCHPYIAGLAGMIAELNGAFEKEKEKLAYRPGLSQYKIMTSVIQYFLNSVNIASMLKRLRAMNPEQMFSEENVALSGMANQFEAKLSGFANKIRMGFSAYLDLVYPFITGAEMVLFGLQTLAGFAKAHEYIKESVEDNVAQLLSFPSLSLSSEVASTPLEMASLLTNQCIFSSVAHLHIICSPDLPPNKNRNIDLCKSALLELVNESVMLHKPKKSRKEILKAANNVFRQFAEVWKHERDVLREKKEKEESMYEVRTHCDELNEEQMAEEQMRIMFPLYHQEFQEFLPAELEEAIVQASPSPKKLNCGVVITDEVCLELWSCHATIISNFLQSNKEFQNNLKPIIKSSDDADFVTPFLVRYDLLKLYHRSFNDLNQRIDARVVGGHIVAAASLQLRKSIGNNNAEDIDRTHDIYHDANTAEVLELIPHLESFLASIDLFLKKFPENPLLLKMKEIVNRINGLSVSSPLLKFVTGLELLLDSAQLWEQNAIEEVSLAQHLEFFTKKMVHYRRIELKCWSQCLDTVLKKHFTSRATYWFHLYELISKGDIDAEEMDKILKLLQQFLEDSPLGQFQANLGLLQTFVCHLKIVAESEGQKKLLAMLSNVYSFYEQFIDAVKKEIMTVREPIEKEIKEFVKISKWSDSRNFHAIKEVILKSHRTLYKYIRKFETALKKLARLHFHVHAKEDIGDNHWSLNVSLKEFVPIVNAPVISYEITGDFDDSEDSKFNDLGHYYRRTKRICRKSLRLFTVMHDVNTLNDFARNIIEDIKELQEEDVKKFSSKEEQKKALKQNVQLKRMALSELFKKLVIIGLSYRKGVVYWDTCVSPEVSLRTPFLSSEMWDHYDAICSSTHVTATCWRDTNHYYYKCIAQLAELQTSIQSPSKELHSVALLDRFKGFAGDLFQKVINQRRTLAEKAERIIQFSEIVSSLCDVISTKDQAKNLVMESEDIPFPPQDFVTLWKTKLCKFLVQSLVTFQQFEILLNCCPGKLENEAKVIHPKISTPLASVEKGDGLWNAIICDVQVAIGEIKKSISVVSDALQSAVVLHTWEHLSVISSNIEAVSQIVENFVNSHRMHLCKVSNGNEFTNLTVSLHCLHNLAIEISRSFSNEVGFMCNKDISDQERTQSPEKQFIVNLADELLTKVLKTVENFFCFTTDLHAQEISHAVAPDVLPDKLLSQKIELYLRKSGEHLNMNETLRGAEKVVRYVIEASEKSSENSTFITKYILNIVPFLSQYNQLLKMYLVGAVGAHRTSCKFLSILLGLFTDLCQRGFCIPQELEPVSQKSGATEFHDIEQGGLGDGEGEKDVSKDIKSEDQLEGAFKEGMQQENNDDERADIKEEEEGIEMSDDFEGDMYDPEPESAASDEDEEEGSEELDLDKQMGDVQQQDSDKLNEQIWGGESDDDDDDLQDDDAGEGVTQNQSSELVAKDNKEKELDSSSKDKNVAENCPDLKNEEEYDGEHPLADVPPLLEAEAMDLPEEMEIGNDDANVDAEGENERDDVEMSDHDGDEKEAVEEGSLEQNEAEVTPDVVELSEDENEDHRGKAEECLSDGEDDDVEHPEHEGEKSVPHGQPLKPTNDKAEAADDATNGSSHDNVVGMEQEVNAEKWEKGMQEGNEKQQKEGYSEFDNSKRTASEQRGEAAASTLSSDGDDRKSGAFKQPDEERTLGDPNKSPPRRLKISYQKPRENHKKKDIKQNANEYQHVKDGEDEQQALDIATEEQASKQNSVHKNEQKDSDEEEEDGVIAIDSSSEREEIDDDYEEDNIGDAAKSVGDTAYRKTGHKDAIPGEAHSADEDMAENMEDDNEDFVQTLSAQPNPESTIHTQTDLWSSLSVFQLFVQRQKIEAQIDIMNSQDPRNENISFDLWYELENIVAPLVHELCEQLRLVLEPTKMTKLKGDYRTGKRLNMRKIIPYIASQFRKDKIWLRRTKPSKRQYQIMLAVDDSSSMVENNAKELAFESLVLLGKSLSYLEAGEMAVVSFGEEVKLLHGFGQSFTNSSGARILESFSFAQKKTGVRQVVEYATASLISHKLRSKDISQLLIIISDGRGVFNDGEEAIRLAIRQAVSNNIFMVFIVLDSPLNKDSILDIQCPSFDGNGEVKMTTYMEKFPFPFYVILRNIGMLPPVLGEALRQWFELVTSAER